MLTIKSPEEIEIMREAGRRLARVLRELQKDVRPGITTAALDERAAQLIKEVGSVPAFLGYQPGGADKPYPATLCASVNETVVHGLPSEYVLQDGDLLSLDLGLIHEGFYSDSAVTIAVGTVSDTAKRLVFAAHEALKAGIAQAKPGNTLGDIGHAIESIVTRQGFSIADLLTGHGIGRNLHEDPYVYNEGEPGQGEPLEEGMVIAIEPMITAGKGKVRQLADDSFVTADRSMAAHFEHTIAITRAGPRVLTSE